MFDTIKKHSANQQAVTDAQILLRSAGFDVAVDGKFGARMEDVVMAFQSVNDLVMDGIIGPKTWRVLTLMSGEVMGQVAQRFLSEDDLENAAQRLGIELAAVKAINAVESKGQGFLNDYPVILFERHVFWKRLQVYGIDPNNHVAGNEDILNTRSGGYRGGIHEVRRLQRAQQIHPQAACESASWGLFQIMGFHWKKLGYPSIEGFVDGMQHSEMQQLEAFVRYMEVFGCSHSLQLTVQSSLLTLNNFSDFAYCYNGPQYAKYHYHTRMMKAYLKYHYQSEAQRETRPMEVLPKAA